jgi:hypothetical protein
MSEMERVRYYKDVIQEQETELLIKNIETNNLTVQLRDINAKAESLEQSLAAKEGEILNLRKFKEGKKVFMKEQVNELQAKLLEKDKDISDLKETVKEIKPLKTCNAKQKKEISKLKALNDKLSKGSITQVDKETVDLQMEKSSQEFTYSIPVIVNKFSMPATPKQQTPLQQPRADTCRQRPHVRTTTRKSPSETEVLVVGDSSVRGLGPLIQSSNPSGSVSVSGGGDINFMLNYL